MAEARELAEHLVDLVHQLSEARAEREAYRLAEKQAIHLLHERHLELTRLRGQHEALKDEYRRHRERAMRADGRRVA